MLVSEQFLLFTIAVQLASYAIRGQAVLLIGPTPRTPVRGGTPDDDDCYVEAALLVTYHLRTWEPGHRSHGIMSYVNSKDSILRDIIPRITYFSNPSSPLINL